MRCLTAVIVAGLGALGWGCVTAQPMDPLKSPSPLRRYTQCQYANGLGASSIDRAPKLPMARPVETASGTKPVSVADGYRVMLAFPGRGPFVNLKIERSVDGRFALDKQTVLEQMQFVATSASGAAFKLEHSKSHGIDIAALNSASLDNATISFYSLFDDKTVTIASAYLLNQAPDKRSFQDLAQFRSQRDQFVADLVSCLQSSAMGK